VSAGDPEDYERILRAFRDAHEQAIDPFMNFLRETAVEIRIVEFMCDEDPIAAKATVPASAGRLRRGWRTPRSGSTA
jgi:hypothetical protein